MSQSYPAYSIPALYSYGLIVSVETDTSLVIFPGQCRDSNNIMDIVLDGSPLDGVPSRNAIVLDATKTGPNGLDQGILIADSLYSVYVIADSSYKNRTASLLSLSSNEFPLLPKGYDSYRLISYIPVDGTAIFIGCNISGNGTDKELLFDTDQNILTNGTATTNEFVDCSLLVPNELFIILKIRSILTPDVAGDTAYIGEAYSIGQVSGVQISDYCEITCTHGELVGFDYSLDSSSDSLDLFLHGYRFSI